MWSFQDGPASALPLTQTLSNIYGQRSATPDVPGSDVDEIQVRANFVKVNCRSLKHFRDRLSLHTKTCSIREAVKKYCSDRNTINV